MSDVGYISRHDVCDIMIDWTVLFRSFLTKYIEHIFNKRTIVSCKVKTQLKQYNITCNTALWLSNNTQQWWENLNL